MNCALPFTIFYLFQPWLIFHFMLRPSFSDEATTEPQGNPNEIGPCYSLDSVMNIFNKSQYRSLPEVQELLGAYKYNNYLRELNSLPKQHIFIAVEAPRRRKRYLIAKKLAKAIGAAAVMFSPPVGWSRFRSIFNNTLEIRRAFHALSIYGSANNAQQYLGRRPVVMSGYWLDQATFSIAKKYYPNLPPSESQVYYWPKDLMRPDFIFFVNEPLPKAYIERREESIRYQILQVYRRWRDPPVTELYVDDDIGIDAVVDEITKILDSSIPQTTTTADVL